MSATLLLIFELAGTIAFAISGAMVGLKKRMDLFGIIILGVTTAVGGGVIRDLVLGRTPPATFQDPIYALVAIGSSVAVVFPAVRSQSDKRRVVSDRLMLVMDSVGLGIFTAVGIKAAYTTSDTHNWFLLLFVGVITGIGGGIVRDVLAGNIPEVFARHFYACASLIGAVVCIISWDSFGETLAMFIGSGVCVILRFLAVRYHWQLPRPE